jgi:aspartyl protease family protein
MIAVAWILALLLLTGVFERLLNRQRNPNASPVGAVSESGTREVRLVRNRSGHYVAIGRINGVHVEFLLDTGATAVSIPGSIADRIGLRRGAPGFADTANGRITVYRTVLDRVELGPVALDRVTGFVNPSSEVDQVLLGMSFLKHVELVQRGDTLTIRQLSSPQ